MKQFIIIFLGLLISVTALATELGLLPGQRGHIRAPFGPTLFWDSQNACLGIGSNNLSAPTTTGLELIGDGRARALINTVYINAATGGGAFTGRASRGTSVAPLTLNSADRLFALTGTGYNGTSFTGGRAQIRMTTEEAWTLTNNGTNIGFWTTPLASVNLAERLRIDAAGHLNTLQTTAPTLSACGTSPSTVTGTDNNGVFTVGSSATTCTLTFNTAWTNVPQCFVTDQTTALVVKIVPGTGTAVFTTATASAISSQVLAYFCIGRE